MSLIPLLKSFLLILLLAPRYLPAPGESNSSRSGFAEPYLVLVPVGESRENYPVLKPIPPEDPRNPVIRELFEYTFIREMIPLHDSVQEFLLRAGSIPRKEPLYLLLSGRMGGFPMKGFYLKLGETLEDKTHVHYVDLPDVDRNYAGLSSITQIFPHELAHIYYRQMTGRDPEQELSFSPDVHYFSIVTDYAKAFNEGYAESYENLSRIMEPDPRVREGTSLEVQRLSHFLERFTRGFERDYRWPLRLGFYRMSMLFWYQRLEDYKRFIWAKEGQAGFPAPVTGIRSVASRISFRNACVAFDSSRLLNTAQALSCEGVVNSFFTRLRNRPAAGIAAVQAWKELLVMQKYLREVRPGISPLQQFIDGYIREYPLEEKNVREAFIFATGQPYRSEPIPEIWLYARDRPYTCWVMAQYGGVDLPGYPLNLNTARQEDLLMLNGLPEPDAARIVAWRDSAGFFRTAGEIVRIPGLAPGTPFLIASRVLNPEEPALADSEARIGLSPLVIGPVKQMVISAGILAIAISLFLYALFCFRKSSARHVVSMVIRTFFKALMFMVAGLAFVIFLPHPWIGILALWFLLMLIHYLRSRKIRKGLIVPLLSTTTLTLATLWFVW